MRLRAAVVSLFVVTGTVRAQTDVARWQPETRAEVLASDASAVHLLVGANVVTGLYVRGALVAGGGVRKAGDEWRRSGQLTAWGRFHLDPLGQFSRGLYVAGGASLFFDDGIASRVRLAVAVGVDLTRAERPIIPGAEIALGGGLRLAVTLRPSRRGAR